MIGQAGDGKERMICHALMDTELIGTIGLSDSDFSGAGFSIGVRGAGDYPDGVFGTVFSGHGEFIGHLYLIERDGFDQLSVLIDFCSQGILLCKGGKEA